MAGETDGAENFGGDLVPGVDRWAQELQDGALVGTELRSVRDEPIAGIANEEGFSAVERMG